MHDEPLESARPDKRSARVGLLVAAALLACQLPLAWRHFAGLWHDRPHYQFFPLVLAAFAWLLWRRWPRGDTRHTRTTRWLAWLLMGAGTLGLAAAVAVASPWGGAVAGLVTAGGFLVYLAGRSAFSELGAVWLLLWTTIPPPGDLDGRLVRLLQTTASRYAGFLLDWLQLDHLRADNVFELPDWQLSAADPCGGVHSPLVLIVLGLLLAVVRRRSVLQAVLLAAAAVGWSLAVNIARVTVIVVAAAWWDVDWSGGWQHQVLGYALTLLGLGLLLSTDALLSGLLGPVLDFALICQEVELLPLASDPLSRLWNRVVARTGPTKSAARSPPVQTGGASPGGRKQTESG